MLSNKEKAILTYKEIQRRKILKQAHEKHDVSDYEFCKRDRLKRIVRCK